MSEKEKPQVRRVVQIVQNSSHMQLPVPVIVKSSKQGVRPVQDYVHLAPKRRLELPLGMEVQPNFLALHPLVTVTTREV